MFGDAPRWGGDHWQSGRHRLQHHQPQRLRRGRIDKRIGLGIDARQCALPILRPQESYGHRRLPRRTFGECLATRTIADDVQHHSPIGVTRLCQRHGIDEQLDVLLGGQPPHIEKPKRALIGTGSVQSRTRPEEIHIHTAPPHFELPEPQRPQVIPCGNRWCEDPRRVAMKVPDPRLHRTAQPRHPPRGRVPGKVGVIGRGVWHAGTTRFLSAIPTHHELRGTVHHVRVEFVDQGPYPMALPEGGAHIGVRMPRDRG